MKTTHKQNLLSAAVACVLVVSNAPAQAAPNSVNTRIGKLNFDLGMPKKETVAKLFDELDFQRAVQSYLWALLLVSAESLRQAQELNAGARNGDLVIYDTYRDKAILLTPNITTPYIIAFLDLAERGPMVLEIPRGPTAGFMDDFWQRPTGTAEPHRLGLPSQSIESASRSATEQNLDCGV
jgi:hypothetical protein